MMQNETVVSLYDGIAPGSENWKQNEVTYNQWDMTLVRNVVTPTLTAFLPEASEATGEAVIVAPGGGFCFLSWETEGTMVAEWLRAHGIAAFLLKYRLADMGQTEDEYQTNMQQVVQSMLAIAAHPNPPEELQRYPNLANVVALAKEDGRQAIRHVHENAAQYHVNPDQIGLMGFSAGGILALDVALQHGAESRPNFIAPIYGISHDPLLVPDDAPPMFFVCALDDHIVAPHADKLYEAWRSAKKSVEMHVYAKGGHGFGLRKQELPIDRWIEQFKDWLNTINIRSK